MTVLELDRTGRQRFGDLCSLVSSHRNGLDQDLGPAAIPLKEFHTFDYKRALHRGPSFNLRSIHTMCRCMNINSPRTADVSLLRIPTPSPPPADLRSNSRLLLLSRSIHELSWMHEDAMAHDLCLRRLAGDQQYNEERMEGEVAVFMIFSNSLNHNSHPVGIHQRPLIILLFVAAAVLRLR